MPLKYDPDTGIPSYVPDLGQELEEGVTPTPTVIDSKSDPFKGDKPLGKTDYERLRDGPPPDAATADRLLEEAIAKAKPARLDAKFATDEEVTAIEQLARAQEIEHWPLLIRLINRLRRAEAA